MTDDELMLCDLQRRIILLDIRCKQNGYIRTSLPVSGREISALRRIVGAATLDGPMRRADPRPDDVCKGAAVRMRPERSIPTWPWWVVLPLALFWSAYLDSLTGRPVEAFWRWMVG